VKWRDYPIVGLLKITFQSIGGNQIATVLVIDDHNCVLLVRQYRHTVRDVTVDIPGGGETHVYLLAHKFCKPGHELAVITVMVKEQTMMVDDYPLSVICLQGFREFEDEHESSRNLCRY